MRGTEEPSIDVVDADVPDVDFIAQANERLLGASPRETLKWVYDTYGDDAVMATGFGPSGVVLMQLLSDINPGASVFYLDTDLLYPETYTLRDELAERFDITFVRVGALSLEEQAARHGDRLWERDPDRCCFLRKVQPLRQFLSDRKAWITGIRRDQSRVRAVTDIVGWDDANGLVKVNPLALWSEDDVWSYIHLNELPYNPLHDAGFPSIGCMPCTQAVAPGEDPRAGRWRGRSKTECGIHIKA